MTPLDRNATRSCAVPDSAADSAARARLIYVFHENTNFARHATGKSGVKSLVRPPRLGGEKVGLFSTRTPHRPNPIGLSLVRLDRVDAQVFPAPTFAGVALSALWRLSMKVHRLSPKGTLYLSGIDLIDRTPVLDVCVPAPSCAAPRRAAASGAALTARGTCAETRISPATTACPRATFASPSGLNLRRCRPLKPGPSAHGWACASRSGPHRML